MPLARVAGETPDRQRSGFDFARASFSRMAATTKSIRNISRSMQCRRKRWRRDDGMRVFLRLLLFILSTRRWWPTTRRGDLGYKVGASAALAPIPSVSVEPAATTTPVAPTER
jgi:hypothetical protein